ncbi:MAG: DNA-directed RNA polymerase subunit beta' [Candidatus Gracilibacteria bacterium]
MPQVTKNSKITDFEAISVAVASPDDIMSWSYGEVVKPETINYRTQKPERGGLFCEKIFGPTKNWQCYCGKYKRVRYEGVVCEKCGVEVTRSIVRRERMAHIKLAVPVTHIWYLRSTPSRIGLLLNLPVKQLEQVVYFAAYIITDLDEEQREKASLELDEENKSLTAQMKQEHQLAVTKAKAEKLDTAEVDAEYAAKIDELKENYTKSKDDLKKLKVGQIASEMEYRELSMQFGHVFKAGIGAEALRYIVEKIDLDEFIEERKVELTKTSGQKQKKIIKRLKLASSIKTANVRPEWMILTVLPVIPPDLRPMVQLDGGRFAASDLNDLYRRVINRNNRLKRLLEINAPEVICRNEKRMLQEAVDALLNSDARQGKTTFNVNERRKLRSLSDMLKGKQGRFRQNLLGKRVDYSGRSVIVVGPELLLHQCGLPKEMALKLFKPFVIGELIRTGLAYNLKNAERVIASNKKEVWDILEYITHDRYVLLNRAPTLHRLGIQAFQPVLIDGKAIRVHPLVCTAFNADFDGDQMAVHLPLSDRAQNEAKNVISSVKNLLKPAGGSPVTTPTKDMILGYYYLTKVDARIEKSLSRFYDIHEALRAYELGVVKLQQMIDVRINGKIIETTIGRILFNEILPEQLRFINIPMNKKEIEKLVMLCLNTVGEEETAHLCDGLKKLGFKYATYSGLSMGYRDMVTPIEKYKMLSDTEEEVRKIVNLHYKGFLSQKERYQHVVQKWLDVKKQITALVAAKLDEYNHVTYMIRSGARGNIDNLSQISGMKGSVVSPSGKIIELPVRSNFTEGFSILEFFIAAHSGRKGKADTALKTANAGYLTRRLVDSTQDILIKEEDCGTEEFRVIPKPVNGRLSDLIETKLFGRLLAEPLIESKTGEVLAETGSPVDYKLQKVLEERDVDNISIRSVITCHTENGVCRKCYGFDLGSNKVVEIGTAVGVIAAQSIGEPGTQLTMRTFHTGGVAGGADVTLGLNRVEELFEARSPKTPAFITEISGIVALTQKKDYTEVVITADELALDMYHLSMFKPAVKKDELVKAGQVIARSQVDKNVIKARLGGKVEVLGDHTVGIRHTDFAVKEYKIPSRFILVIKDGQRIMTGEKISEGHLDLRKNLELRGVQPTQEYIIDDVQTIYTSQGQSINDKHLEIVVKQMFSKVKIVESGDTGLLPGEIINLGRLDKLNRGVILEGKRAAEYERLLFGLTKVATYTESWLSAASFQETIRILVEASVKRMVDLLKGLKENVIIGKPIPTGEHFYRKNSLTNT